MKYPACHIVLNLAIEEVQKTKGLSKFMNQATQKRLKATITAPIQ